MPKQANKERRELIHVSMPLDYHLKFKAQVAKDGSNITATVNDLIENYLIERGAIQRPNMAELKARIWAD